MLNRGAIKPPRKKLLNFTPRWTWKRTFSLAAVLGLGFAALYFRAHLSENIHRYQEVYRQIPELIAKKRKFHHQIPPQEFILAHQCSSDSASSSSPPPPPPPSVAALDLKQEHREPVVFLDARNEKETFLLRKPLVTTPSSSSSSSVDSSSSSPNCVGGGGWILLGGEDICDRKYPSARRFLEAECRSKNNKEEGCCENSEREEVAISIGFRRALAKDSIVHKLGITVTHAVALVQVFDKNEKKKSKNQAEEEEEEKVEKNNNFKMQVVGYNARKLRDDCYFTNDLMNETTSREMIFYEELTLRGTKEEALEFFAKLEELSTFDYKVLTCNCFSSLVKTFLWANQTKLMRAPEMLDESLLITLPQETNWGLGIVTNKSLKPLAEDALSTLNYALRQSALQDSGIIKK